MGESSGIDPIKRGHGSPERQLAGELWDADSFPRFAAHRAKGDYDPTYSKIDYRRYYDRDYAQREHERVWMKSWLKACRKEELPEVGDRLPVQIGPDETVFEKATAFRFLGTVFDQDYENLPRVQIGARSAAPTRHHTRLGSHQEFVIKQFHELFDERMVD